MRCALSATDPTPVSSPTTGTRNLAQLIAGMNPVLDPVQYVFANIAPGTALECAPLMRLSEAEADTVILTIDDAEAINLPADRRFSRITLTIHSDLEAVGLTAAFATCLADKGISANVVAGYYHDHIFVPTDDAETAMHALQELARSPR